MDDRVHMAAALDLAESGLGQVWPNPSVGCLVVRDGAIVASGRTQLRGRPHAEVVALEGAGDRARGATLYVSLEPCCHFGRTPPCTQAVIEAGVARVVVATLDPDPRVNGQGVGALRAAGIDVEVGLESERARAINAGFFTRVHHGRPWLAEVVHASGIPDGFDAIWRGEPESGWLEVRVGLEPERWALGAPSTGVRILEVRGLDVPSRLAAEGLTRVAVEAGGPIGVLLRSAGFLDG